MSRCARLEQKENLFQAFVKELKIAGNSSQKQEKDAAPFRSSLDGLRRFIRRCSMFITTVGKDDGLLLIEAKKFVDKKFGVAQIKLIIRFEL